MSLFTFLLKIIRMPNGDLHNWMPRLSHRNALKVGFGETSLWKMRISRLERTLEPLARVRESQLRKIEKNTYNSPPFCFLFRRRFFFFFDRNDPQPGPASIPLPHIHELFFTCTFSPTEAISNNLDFAAHNCRNFCNGMRRV